MKSPKIAKINFGQWIQDRLNVPFSKLLDFLKIGQILLKRFPNISTGLVGYSPFKKMYFYFIFIFLVIRNFSSSILVFKEIFWNSNWFLVLSTSVEARLFLVSLVSRDLDLFYKIPAIHWGYWSGHTLGKCQGWNSVWGTADAIIAANAQLQLEVCNALHWRSIGN